MTEIVNVRWHTRAHLRKVTVVSFLSGLESTDGPAVTRAAASTDLELTQDKENLIGKYRCPLLKIGPSLKALHMHLCLRCRRSVLQPRCSSASPCPHSCLRLGTQPEPHRCWALFSSASSRYKNLLHHSVLHNHSLLTRTFLQLLHAHQSMHYAA